MGMGNMYDPGWDAGYAAGADVAVGIGAFFLIFWLVFVLLTLALSAAIYVMQALGLYSIAKRRGIRNPWLSWVPVGNMWTLGCIADQYQYVAKKKVTNRRKVLLGLVIAMYGVLALYMVFMLKAAFSGISAEIGAYAAGSVLMWLACMILAVIAAVFQYIAMYELYASCDPGNAVAFLLLSIFVSVSYPILMFICRNKDLGMPVRKVSIEEEPVYEPVAEE